MNVYTSSWQLEQLIGSGNNDLRESAGLSKLHIHEPSGKDRTLSERQKGQW